MTNDEVLFGIGIVPRCEAAEMSDAETRECLGEKTDQAPVARFFDLEERSAVYGETVIGFLKKVPSTNITIPLIRQLVRSATSVGANYSEADDSVSKADFKHRISICQKEARESKYWLRMIAAAVPAMREEARTLWREAHELHLIFSSIRRKTNSAK